jgi:hypothetical protein
MAQRIWRAQPDSVVYIGGRQVPVVSREQQVELVLDGVVFLDRSGGALLVEVGRELTDLPGEAVTTGMIVRWQEGRRARVQPEARVEVSVPERAPKHEPAYYAFEDGVLDENGIPADDEIGPEEEPEDVSAMPEGTRG